MTQFNEPMNTVLLKDICSQDETGIFEAIANISIEHGMPIDNLSGFMVDLMGVINRWSEMMHK